MKPGIFVNARASARVTREHGVRRVFAAVLASVAMAIGLAAQQAGTPAGPTNSTPSEGPSRETGWPFLTCYTSKEYGATSQNWVFAQDNRGVLYVGNSLGVLEYDGASWRLIQTPNKGLVRALASDEHGRIYVGTTADFGYLAPNAAGQMQYVSLIEHVKPDDRVFNDVWTAYVTPQGVYFQSRERLFRATPPNPSLAGDTWHVRSWNPQGPFSVCDVGGRHVLRAPAGRRADAHGRR